MVLAIVGVLAGVVAFNFLGAGRERELQTEAERLAGLVELARVESVQRNEAWGLIVKPAAYSFAAYDEDEGRWWHHAEGTFRPRNAPAGVSLQLTAQRGGGEVRAVAVRQRPQDVPRILIFPSGEQTPFAVRLVPDWDATPWLVRSDGIQRTRAQRESDDTP